MSNREIADALGVSEGTVRNDLGAQHSPSGGAEERGAQDSASDPEDFAEPVAPDAPRARPGSPRPAGCQPRATPERRLSTDVAALLARPAMAYHHGSREAYRSRGVWSRWRPERGVGEPPSWSAPVPRAVGRPLRASVSVREDERLSASSLADGPCETSDGLSGSARRSSLCGALTGPSALPTVARANRRRRLQTIRGAFTRSERNRNPGPTDRRAGSRRRPHRGLAIRMQARPCAAAQHPAAQGPTASKTSSGSWPASPETGDGSRCDAEPLWRRGGVLDR
jgi:hypothetical protein